MEPRGSRSKRWKKQQTFIIDPTVATFTFQEFYTAVGFVHHKLLLVHTLERLLNDSPAKMKR